MRQPLAILWLILLAGSSVQADDFEWGRRNTSFEPAYSQQFRAPVQVSDVQLQTRVLAQGLSAP